MGSRFSFSATAILVGGALSLAPCTAVRPSYDKVDHSNARIVGMPNVRAWADSPNNWDFRFDVSGSPPTMLALSGGGAEGAYGAGFLSVWSDKGTRPQFRIVTGTSVGALMAPLAFLGPGYDSKLSEVFMNGEIIVLDAVG